MNKSKLYIAMGLMVIVLASVCVGLWINATTPTSNMQEFRFSKTFTQQFNKTKTFYLPHGSVSREFETMEFCVNQEEVSNAIWEWKNETKITIQQKYHNYTYCEYLDNIADVLIWEISTEPRTIILASDDSIHEIIGDKKLRFTWLTSLKFANPNGLDTTVTLTVLGYAAFDEILEGEGIPN